MQIGGCGEGGPTPPERRLAVASTLTPSSQTAEAALLPIPARPECWDATGAY